MRNIIKMVFVCFSFLIVSEVDTLQAQCISDNTFTGATSNDWSTPSNWSTGCVPGGGTISGIIRITADCVVSSSDNNNYSFGQGSSLIIAPNFSFTNNGSGTWNIENIEGNGSYTANLTVSGAIKPGYVDPPVLICNVDITTVVQQGEFQNERAFTATSSPNIVSWSWDFGDGAVSYLQNPTHLYASTGNFPVTVTIVDASGCMSTDETMVQINWFVKQPIPAVFTPNGDGINDEFLIESFGLTNYVLIIKDRRGITILTIPTPNVGWNGNNASGVPLITGGYLFELRSDQFNQLGAITLLR